MSLQGCKGDTTEGDIHIAQLLIEKNHARLWAKVQNNETL